MSESVEKSSEVTLVTDGCFWTRRGLDGSEWDASSSISWAVGDLPAPWGRLSSSPSAELSDMRTCLPDLEEVFDTTDDTCSERTENSRSEESRSALLRTEGSW